LGRWAGRQKETDLIEAARDGGTVGFALASALADLSANPTTPTPDSGADTRLVAALLPAGREAFTRLEPLLEAGFRVFKWKVGVGSGADERAMLDDLLGCLPETARLRLDANGAWDRREAERWLSVTADRPIEHLEQPIAADARGADDVLSGLAADYPTPIALDESLVGPADLAKWIERRWSGVWVLKPALLGDAAPILTSLGALGAEVVFSSALETVVGMRAALRVAWTWKGNRRALGFGVGPLFDLAVCNGPTLAPWWRWADVAALNPEAAWNALS
jgi:O-succinylbenzoate synthase